MSLAGLVALSFCAYFAERYLLPRVLRGDAAPVPPRGLPSVMLCALCVAAATVFLSMVLWLCDTFVLAQWGLSYLRPAVYALALVGFARLKTWGMAHVTPKLYPKVVGFVPGVVLQSAMLAIAPLWDAVGYSAAKTALYALAVSGVYLVTTLLAYSAERRLQWAAPPKHLAGLPLALIFALLLVMALR